MKKIQHLLLILLAFCILPLLFCGCSTTDGTFDLTRINDLVSAVETAIPKLQILLDREVSDTDVGDTYYATNTVTSGSGTAITEDETAFAAFRWTYGGVDHSGAQPGTPRLSGASISGNTLYYTWNVGLSDWGLGNTDAGAICSLFIQLADGSWAGGKFDWVSTSRASRGLKHINGEAPYKNWGDFPWGNTPNPTKAAFVVTKADGSLRSNVIVCDWTR